MDKKFIKLERNTKKMEENKANITIDDQNRIRIVEVNVFRESDQLRNDCLEFIKSIPLVF